MTQGCRAKEFHKLLKNVKKMSDGQVSVSEWDEECVATFNLEIKPHGGMYRGGTFSFKVVLDDEFPQQPPVIRCETPIYHPNIDPTDDGGDTETNICLNMFETGDWQEGYGMDGIIQGLLFLFYEPNLEDPLSPYFGETSVEDYEENVLKSLQGECVEGCQFPRNCDGEMPDGEDGKDESDNVKKVESKVNETKYDNSVSESDENIIGNVPKCENNTADNVDDVNHSVADSVQSCVSDLCNTPVSINDDPTVLSELEGQADNQIPEPLKGQSFGISLKPKENIAQTPVITQSNSDQPDVIQLSNDDCSASCPDVVAMTTDHHGGSREPASKGMPISLQKKVSDVCSLQHKLAEQEFVSLNSFDAVMPEMNFVFTMLKQITKSIKT